jgi:hypothetical protein
LLLLPGNAEARAKGSEISGRLLRIATVERLENVRPTAVGGTVNEVER